MAISERFAATLFPSGVVGSLPRPLLVKAMLPDLPGPESAAAARSPPFALATIAAPRAFSLSNPRNPVTP